VAEELWRSANDGEEIAVANDLDPAGDVESARTSGDGRWQASPCSLRVGKKRAAAR
jgi:hypothetical protein